MIFPEEGGANSQSRCTNLIILQFFLSKTAWKWKNLDPEGMHQCALWIFQSGRYQPLMCWSYIKTSQNPWTIKFDHWQERWRTMACPIVTAGKIQRLYLRSCVYRRRACIPLYSCTYSCRPCSGTRARSHHSQRNIHCHLQKRYDS